MAALVLACQGLTACSIATQLKPDFDQEPTGSIAPAQASSHALRPPVAALPASLDAEDQRRALGALAIALDPQGNGATVRWDNPVSKAKGSLTPVGYAYPKNGLVCRGFSAQIESPGLNQSARGVACRDKNADWSLAEYQPAQKARPVATVCRGAAFAQSAGEFALPLAQPGHCAQIMAKT
jgi:surface antigen